MGTMTGINGSNRISNETLATEYCNIAGSHGVTSAQKDEAYKRVNEHRPSSSVVENQGPAHFALLALNTAGVHTDNFTKNFGVDLDLANRIGNFWGKNQEAVDDLDKKITSKLPGLVYSDRQGAIDYGKSYCEQREPTKSK